MRSTIHIAMAVVVLASCSSHSSPPQAGGRSGSGGARLVASGTGEARSGHVAALLGDGRVLLAGGAATTSAQLFDPNRDPSHQFATAAASQVPYVRVHATATVLQDGRVLVVGGDLGSAPETAELYDPVTDTWTLTGPMPSTGARSFHTATRLDNGQVVIIGGQDGTTALGTVELYTPSARPGVGSWSTLPSLATPRTRHTATLLLPGGDILVAGGEDGSTTPVGNAERYAPSGAGPVASLSMSPRSRHVAALLPSGYVLIAGGTDGSAELGDCLVFDGTGFVGPLGAVAPRVDSTASVLPDGRVVVAGGTHGGDASTSVDVYTVTAPDAVSITSTGRLTEARGGHAATVLPTGRILLTGGGSGSAEVLDRLADAWTHLAPAHYDPRYGHTATLLVKGDNAGKVLVVGGRYSSTGYWKGWQIFDPATPGTMPVAQNLTNARSYHTATVLLDGSVLVAGGNAGADSHDTAELFDGSSTWMPVGRMTAPRAHHTATLLPSGRVLIAGGLQDATTALASAELYDPSTRTFTATAGAMSTPRAYHVATLLPDGRVLLAGGGSASAEVYDPAVDAFSPAGDLTSARAHFTASPLLDGRVLFTSGTDGALELASAELFAGIGAYAAVLGPPSGRVDHAAAPLPGGEILVAGGQSSSGLLDLVERYEPSGESFLDHLTDPLLGNLLQPRDQFTLTQLPSGQLLAWGGEAVSGVAADPELYDAFAPAALPPDLAAGPSAAVPGQVLHLTAAGGASFTSAVGGEDRPVFIITREDGDGVLYAVTTDFTASSATVRLPAVAPGGWWWLRAIVGGVPGEARPFRMFDPFQISPLEPTVPPRGSMTFQATGGSRTGYSWSLTADGSRSATEVNTQPAIDAAGVYVAGAVPDSVDTVQCADALDPTVTVSTDVRIGPGITIAPGTSVGAAPARPIAFSATGGCDPAVYGPSCTGYTWSYAAGGNRSGGTLGADGAYVAGPHGGVADDIQVVDVLGNHAEAQILVTNPIVIDPTSLTRTPLGTATFTASNGCDPAVYGDRCGPYTWTVVTAGSGEATIDAGGNYRAGRTGLTTDVVRVTDSLGSFAEATVTVTAGVSISPTPPAATPPGGSIDFVAAGGNDTFTGCPGATGCWSLVTNRSGGQIDAGGHYTAGHTPDVSDVIQVQDTLGNLATVTVAIGPGITLRPVDPGAYPNQTVALTATGGSGRGFTWQITTSPAHGAIAAGATDGTAVYTAGPSRGVLDVVVVTDDLGNTATTDVATWPDWKPAGSGCSSADGGGGVLGLLLVVLFLALRGPRASRAARRAGVALVLLLGATGARAQVPPVTQSFVVDRFQPAGGAYDVLGVQSAQTAGRMQKTFRLYLNYASKPLVLTAPGMHKVALLKSQLAADLTGSLGITDWAEVSLAVPFILSQSREQDRFLPPELRQSVAKSGLGDVRLTPKVRLVEWGKLRLGVAAPIALPVGNKKAFLGHGAVTFGPTALVELDALGPSRLLLNAGALFRPERKLVDLTVGNAITFGAGYEYPFELGDSRLAALATFAGESGMKGSTAARPMELLAGARWNSPSGLEIGAGGGPGIGKGYGTPQYRVFLEVGWTTAGFDRLAPPPKKEEEAKPEEPKAEEPKAEPEQPKAEEPKAEEPKPEPEQPKAEAPKAEEPAPRAEPEETIRIDAHVYFDFNRKDLKEEYKPLLRRLAKRILSEPRMRVVRIEGHADDLGPPDYNLWLSEERARTVKDFLERSGVPKNRFTVIGFGKTKPTKPGRSPDARARNRRVEFSVQEY
jgi:outer membrane protein OmpA-like peptidoglycan-associated protein